MTYGRMSISRLEFRWDHSASGADAYGGSQPRLCANPQERLLVGGELYLQVLDC